MTSMVGRLNAYTCKGCGHRIVTVDREDGVTPFALPCMAEKSCGALMYSLFYRVPQDQRPTHEWRRPSPAELAAVNPAHRYHYDQGGLKLYRIEEGELSRSTSGPVPNWHVRMAVRLALLQDGGLRS